MKKLYFLDEEEKNRILNLHESLTKKQYLSEANEKGGAGYVDPATDTTEAKIARAFYQSAVGGLGTREDKMLTAIQSIKSAVQFWQVNELVKKLPTNSRKLDIAGVINDEMEEDNLEDVKKIKDSLKLTAGITATYGTEDTYVNNVGVANRFKKNSFKITSQPVVAKTGGELDVTWATTYKCVTLQPGATKGKVKKDSSTAYRIGSVWYFNNGRKLVDGKMYPYTCAEFKSDTPAVDSKVAYQQRAKQVNQQTINTTKQIQQSIGQEPTGNLDSIYIERVIDLLKQ